MNPLLLALIVVANAAIFIYFDAARIRDAHHVGVGPRGIAPHAWASMVFLVLPLALPYYLHVRGTAKAAALREGPPPQFTARDLNVWGYVSSVAFLAVAVYLGLIGQFSWAGVAGLGMVAGLFGGRKPVQVGEGERDFELGGAAWDMSAFRPVDDDLDDDDDQRDVVTTGGGSYIPPVAGPGGQVLPGRGPEASGVAGGGAGVDIFAPPQPAQTPAQPLEPAPAAPSIASRPVVADAAPLLAMSASEDDEDVWDPLQADQETQRAREAPVSEPPSAIEPPPAPPAQPPPAPGSPAPQPAAPQPAAPASSEPLYPTPSPAQTQPLSALSSPPPSVAPAPESPLAMTLGEELPPGLVDDEEPSLLDDELAPFELASEEDDEEVLLVEPVDPGDDEDLELLAPLPPVATSSRRPTPRSSLSVSSPPTSSPPTSSPPTPVSPARETARPGVERPARPSAPPVGGYAGQAKSSGATALFVWLAIIVAILGVAWWIGTRDDGVADDLMADGSAVETQVDDESDVVEEAQTAAASRAAAAEEAMRRKMNGWISTYDTVMKPIADLVEQIDFGELQQGACLDLQRHAEKADRQLTASPDEEVEILLRPAFESFLAAGRSCSGGNEVEWSVHLLQAKDHTHETQILLDERYRYVGPFELEQEEALGHQRSLETISGRYLAGQLEPLPDEEE